MSDSDSDSTDSESDCDEMALDFSHEEKLNRLMEIQAHAMKEYDVRPSFIQYVYILFSDKEKRLLNWESVGGLECDKAGFPILDEWKGEDFLSFTGDEFILETGKRRSGKTTFTCWMLSYLIHLFPRCFVMSRSEDMNKAYRHIIPSQFIMSEWREGVFRAMMDFQRDIMKRVADQEDEGLPPNWFRIFCLLDDCISKVHVIRNSEFLNTVATLGRHYQMMTILNTQYTVAITPSVRENVDIAVLFPQRREKSRETLFNEFGSPMQNMGFFLRALDHYTKDYGVLMVDNRDVCNVRIKDIFKFARPPPREKQPQYFMCSPVFWRQNNDMGFEPPETPGAVKAAASRMEFEDGETAVPAIATEPLLEYPKVQPDYRSYHVPPRRRS